MTIINPVSPIGAPVIAKGTVPAIVPFTMRESPSFLSILEGMRVWIDEVLIPYVNENIAGLGDKWNEEVAELQAAWDADIAELNANWEQLSLDLIAQVNAIADGVEADVAEADAARVAAEAAQAAAVAAAELAEQYASQAQAIQDVAITTIFNNAASEFRKAADAVYLTKSQGTNFLTIGNASNLTPLYFTDFNNANPYPTEWSRDPETRSSWVTGQGEDGSAAVVIFREAPNTVPGPVRFYRTFQNLVVGQRYTVTARARCHGDLNTVPAGINVSGLANETGVVLSNLWQTISRTFIATSTTHQVGVWGTVQDLNGSSGVRFDNFGINKSESETFYAQPGTDGAEGNIYNTLYTRSLGPRWQTGTPAAPTKDPRPVVWAHKYSAADRPGIIAPNDWDQLVYAQITKQSGAAYAASVTGYVRHQGGTGQTIGVHGRSGGYTADSDVFGVWAYAAAMDPNNLAKSIIGIESDLNNKGADQGWGATVGSSRGLVIVGADGSNPLTMGIDIGAQSGSPNGKFWTGIRVRTNGIMGSGVNAADKVNDGEAVLLQGSSTQANAYNGIRFQSGNFSTGISFTEANIANNAAILFGDDQRIVVGDGPGVSTYMSFNRTEAYVNLQSLALHANGVKVLGTRRTGWSQATGPSSKAPFDTAVVSVSTLAAHVKALIDDLYSHGIIGE